MATEKNDARLKLKMPSAVLLTLQKIEREHKIKPQELLRHLVAQAAEFYEENGWFSFPQTITPEKFQT
jgi:hypothetical protein